MLIQGRLERTETNLLYIKWDSVVTSEKKAVCSWADFTKSKKTEKMTYLQVH